jgi:hypothetical protein
LVPRRSWPCSTRLEAWFGLVWSAASKEEGTVGDPRGPTPDDLACIELANKVTEYLDGRLDEGQQERIERHLEVCPGCRAALDQFQTVIRLVGRLTPADVASIDALTRDRLTAMLRAARRR